MQKGGHKNMRAEAVQQTTSPGKLASNGYATTIRTLWRVLRTRVCLHVPHAPIWAFITTIMNTRMWTSFYIIIVQTAAQKLFNSYTTIVSYQKHDIGCLAPKYVFHILENLARLRRMTRPSASTNSSRKDTKIRELNLKSSLYTAHCCHGKLDISRKALDISVNSSG